MVEEIFEKSYADIDNTIELVDVEFIKEGANRVLRIYIDKDNGVNFDDCKSVTKFLEKKLDEIDPINDKYILEVSSCGIERVLKKKKDFEKFIGRLVEIKLYKPINNSKVIIGNLKDTSEHSIFIENDETNVVDEIEFDKIANAKLKFIF
ncbi:MAG: ribosome maturation factor RimP [Clostridiales bacterium]|nr:MAG: ribosome maturation factor RimP [Clostridiales bacterium]